MRQVSRIFSSIAGSRLVDECMFFVRAYLCQRRLYCGSWTMGSTVRRERDDCPLIWVRIKYIFVLALPMLIVVTEDKHS